MKIGIVLANYHSELTEKMLEKAKQKAKKLEVNVENIVKVHGAYDTPLPTKRLLQKEEIDAVIVLGAIIKGETDHDQVIANSTAITLQKLSTKYEKPVTLGISGPGMTSKQAFERIEYGANAVEAAHQTINQTNDL